MTLDLGEIPALQALLNGSQPELVGGQRRWLLQSLTKAIREPGDWALLERRGLR